MRHLASQTGWLHRLFELGIAAKGLFAAIEATVGAILLWLPHSRVQGAVDWLVGEELVENPHALIGRLLERLAARFDAPAQHFYAVYLLSHGLAKLIVVILLQRRVAFAYPLAIAVFGAFVVYQLVEFSRSGSPMMLALSLFDCFVIWLTWREWRGAAEMAQRA